MTEYNFEHEYESFLSSNNLFAGVVASFFISLLSSFILLLIFAILQESFEIAFNILMPIWMLYLLIVSIIVFVGGYYSELSIRSQENAKFRYKEFKDWLKVSPNRIIVLKNGYGLKFNSNQGSVVLYPKTVLDLFQFAWYCQKKYDDFKKVEENKKEQKKEVELNNDRIKVLMTLQSDIENILKESKQIVENKVNIV